MSNNDYVQAAAKMSLYDAAYLLWTHKLQLDEVDAQGTPQLSTRSGGSFESVITNVIRKIELDRQSAHEGPTLDRLRNAHPEAADHELVAAIKAAVKFDTDCVKYFSYFDDYSEDLIAAIEAAKRDNPGFSDNTYDRAMWSLGRAMR